jgi:flagellar protein FlbT
MALKIRLKPNEKMIIGGAVVTAGNAAGCDLIIENKVPLLREKDIMTEKEADSLAQRIYFTIQLMYIDEGNLTTYHKAYWELVKDLIGVEPRLLGLIDQVNEHIVSSKYYQALKLAGEFIHYEQEVFKDAEANSITASI